MKGKIMLSRTSVKGTPVSPDKAKTFAQVTGQKVKSQPRPVNQKVK